MSAHIYQARWTVSEAKPGPSGLLTELVFPQALCLYVTHGTSLHSFLRHSGGGCGAGGQDSDLGLTKSKA